MGTVNGYVRVHFLEIRPEEIILGSFREIGAVTRWNKVSNGLLRSIADLSHKLNRVWCGANG